MFIWTARPPRAEAIGVPTPLLQHLAGDFAPRIAGLWPEPHRPFVEAASARRHLVCLGLARIEGQLDPALAATALSAPLRRAVKQIAPKGPQGLTGAMAKLGETAWSRDDYLLLIELLGAEGAAPVLRHETHLSSSRIRGFAALSPALRAAGLCKIALSPPQAEVLGELHEALSRRDGPLAAEAAARRWAAGNGPADVLARALASIRRRMPAPPFPDAERLRSVRTLAQLEELGGQFNNCLAGLRYAGDPDYAWYEWLGDPGAVIELFDERLYGWSLNQARARSNATLPAEAREAINTALRALGVHVGRGSRELGNALGQAAEGSAIDGVAEVIGWCYGD